MVLNLNNQTANAGNNTTEVAVDSAVHELQPEPSKSTFYI